MALHTAVLGSALAFAHFIGSPGGQNLRTITVSLEGGRGQGEAGAVVEGSPVQRKASREIILPAARSVPLPERAKDPDDGRTRSAAGADADGATPQVTGGGVSAESGAAGSAGPDSGGLPGGFSTEQWRQLHIALERAKSYPRFARERGIEGTVLVRFKVLPTGEIENVDIIKSSGSDILDTASVRTVYRAAPMPYVNGWVEVPMSYVLK